MTPTGRRNPYPTGRTQNRWYANLKAYFDPSTFIMRDLPMRNVFHMTAEIYAPHTHSGREVEFIIRDPEYARELSKALKQWAKAKERM